MATPSFPTDRITVRPWADPVIDALGHDPRSSYVETFWLGTLGPSTTWLLRRLATGLDISPEGFDLDLPAVAAQLGLGEKPGPHSPFVRALGRLVRFSLAQPAGERELHVRRKVPPLTLRQVERLPEELQAEHRRLQEAAARPLPVEALRRRARQLALSLLELGENPEATERQLHRWRFHPALAQEALTWAAERHREHLAIRAAAPAPPAAAPAPAVAVAASPPTLRPVPVGGDAA